MKSLLFCLGFVSLLRSLATSALVSSILWASHGNAMGVASKSISCVGRGNLFNLRKETTLILPQEKSNPNFYTASKDIANGYILTLNYSTRAQEYSLAIKVKMPSGVEVSAIADDSAMLEIKEHDGRKDSITCIANP